mgnify:CR=1 FL=1
MDTLEKLRLLATAARYDASCASSGSIRRNDGRGLGNAASAPMGICHTWAADGRCVSLLKVLFSNHCLYDCAYCVNRRSNDLPRASFRLQELVDLTIGFYRRNYIEGLFLSSGIFASPDTTMEILLRVVRKLREEENFHGYIHLKVIPGASPALIREAAFYADRLSVNVEFASAAALGKFAPDKTKEAIFAPMFYLGAEIRAHREEAGRFPRAPLFAPAGQSTQLVVGATPETDLEILRLAEWLYRRADLRRVYYSAYVPVGDRRLLPAPGGGPPLRREHRLYQADWLIRLYGFRTEELLGPGEPFLDLDLDPKTSWALHHPENFPVEVDRADYETLLRVPGIGLIAARRIIAARRAGRLRPEDLPRLGVVMRRARYFITCCGKALAEPLNPASIRRRLVEGDEGNAAETYRQLPLFREA